MSKSITINGYVHAHPGHGSEVTYTFFGFDDAKSMGYTLVGPASFDYTPPGDFNAVAAAVASLEAEKERITEEFNASIRRVNERIAKFQAITYEPEAA